MKKFMLATAASIALMMGAAGAAHAADWNLQSVNGGTVVNLAVIGTAQNVNSVNSSNSNQAVGSAVSFEGTTVTPDPVNPGVVSVKGTSTNHGLVINVAGIGAAANVGSYGSSNSNGAVGAASSATYNAGVY